ncbi:MAG: SDR family oxidoreductase [Polyangiaceae bacterium]|jgi:NAD(P)-dependent dehydrogenase (short-subunit alcohol dehydrogenase family)
MQGKIVVITGANQGIGKASAVALGALGAKVVLVCRNADKGRAAVGDIERAGAKGVDLVLADMGSQADIRRAAAEIRSKHRRIDVLLNNAGVFVPSRRTTVDGLEETFAVNHLGYFLLTSLLIDVLVASAPSRVVSVSSDAHRRSRMRWDDLQFQDGRYKAFGAYGQSKLANILFTRELARRLDGTGVTANCLHPGLVASGFGHTYGGAFGVIVSLARPLMIGPEDGARTSVYLASSPDVTTVTGKYFTKCTERRPSAAALEDGAPERLWSVSERLTALHPKPTEVVESPAHPN